MRRILSVAAACSILGGLLPSVSRAAAPAFSPPPPPDTPGFSVRAVGDSMTSGFGFDREGARLGPTDLLACGNDMPTSDCDGGDTISYPAIWARDHGIADFDNLAVAGAQTADWLPAATGGPGRFFDRLRRVAEDDPDLLLLTTGANPLLSMTYWFVGDPHVIECVESPQVRACAAGWLDKLRVRENLERMLEYVLEHTTKTRVAVLEYPGVNPPLLHGDPDVLVALLNQRIEEAVRSLRVRRPELGSRAISVPAPAGFAEHSLPDLTSMLLPPLDSVFDPLRARMVDLWVLNNDGGTHLNARGLREFAGHLDRRIWGELPDATIALTEASSVAGESAKLGAVLDTGGFDTAFRVEYGAAPGDYTEATPNTWIGRERGQLPWSVVVDRLEPATTYHYRFVVTQQVGDTVKVTRSEPASFTTAATPAKRSAAATATVAADGTADLAYSVEYGPTTAYGEKTARRYVGRPTEPTQLTEVLTHLEPGTTYHYRFVVTRQQGDRVWTERTPDRTLTTGA